MTRPPIRRSAARGPARPRGVVPAADARAGEGAAEPGPRFDRAPPRHVPAGARRRGRPRREQLPPPKMHQRQQEGRPAPARRPAARHGAGGGEQAEHVSDLLNYNINL